MVMRFLYTQSYTEFSLRISLQEQKSQFGS